MSQSSPAMKLRMVYIKQVGDVIATEACYSAYKGFMTLGYPLNFFEAEDLKGGHLRLDSHTLVVGGTTTVHAALRQIGVEPPLPLNIPSSLQSFAGRTIWQTTLGAVRDLFKGGDSNSCFIKPLVATKSFQGCVVSTAGELERFDHFPADMPLEAADPVVFHSEWRCFVHHAKVVGVAHYAGECSAFPDFSIVEKAVQSYEASPTAYAIDFGVTDTGSTLLVEANDALALGAHGLDPVVYARMLEDRWLEVTTGGSEA